MADDNFIEPIAVVERCTDRETLMKRALLFSIVTVGLLCAGCRLDKYVGVWDMRTSVANKSGHSSFTFTKDGSFKSSFETRTAISYTRTEGSGKYSTGKDTLILDYKDLNLVYLNGDGSTKKVIPMHPSKSVEKVKVLAQGKIELSSDTHPDTWRLIRR